MKRESDDALETLGFIAIMILCIIIAMLAKAGWI